MTFDAGAIEATLTLKRDQFQRDLKTAEAEYDAFKKRIEQEVKIKITGVGSGSTPESHQSRTSIQSAGLIGNDPLLLKKLEQSAAMPGGIGILGTGTDTTLHRLLRQQLEKAAQQGAGGIANIGTGPSGSADSKSIQDVTQKVVDAATASSVTQNVKQVQIGPGVSAPSDVTEHVHIDTSESGPDGKQAGSSFSRGFKLSIGGLFASIGGNGGGGGASKAGGDSGDNFAKSFLKSSTFGKVGGIATAVAAGLATLPAIGGLAGVGIGAALIGGVAVTLLKHNAQIANAFKAIGPTVMKTLEEAIQPLVPIVLGIVKQIEPFIKSIEPELKGIFQVIGPSLLPIFNSVKLVITNLLGLMKAAAPAFGPFVEMLLGLVNSILPGLKMLVQATVPVMASLARTVGGLGTDLGAFFKDMAPAVAASAKVLNVVLGAVGQLLPIIGTLAGVFAKVLAPVIVAFTKAFSALEPVLILVGRVIASLAQAVIGSLASSLSLVAKLITAIAPGLKLFVGALGQAFKVLENSGVFFVLANALQEIVKPLSRVVIELLTGLAPVLPQIIGLLAQFVAILAGEAANVLTALLNMLIPLIPAFSELVVWITRLLTGALKPLLPVIAALVIAWYALNVAMAVNPFVAIGVAITLLVVLVIKYHTQILAFIEKTWRTVSNFVQGIWNDILDFFRRIFPIILGVFTGGLSTELALILRYHNQIFATIQRIWNSILGAIRSALATINNAINNAFAAVARSISNTWNGIYNGIVNVLNRMRGAFQSGVQAIGNTWSRLEGIFRNPVSFLINTVYDNGIARLWNDVMGAVSGPKLPIVKGFATGGRVPGYGGGDRHIIAVEGGEAVVPKHLVGPIAPILSALGIPGFQFGGIVGNLLHDVTGTIGKGIDVAKMVAALASGNTTALSNAMSKLVGTSAKGELGEMMIDVPKKIISQVVAHVKTLVSGLFGTGKFTGKFGAGVAQWRPDVLRVLAMLGLPASLANQVLYQMNTESGGNPNAINLTDSNAQAGDPSRGLLQTIGTTFAAYRSAVLPNNIYNPLANIYAAVNYAVHRYGRTLMSGGMGMGSGHGYDSGGMLPPGVSLAYNGTGAHERVLNPAETAAYGSGNAAMLARLDALIAIASRAPRATAAGVGDALGGVARGATYRNMYSPR